MTTMFLDVVLLKKESGYSPTENSRFLGSVVPSIKYQTYAAGFDKWVGSKNAKGTAHIHTRGER